MSETFLVYIALIFIIILLAMLGEKWRIAFPIVLVLGGLALSLIPGLPPIRIDPEIFFLIFLPPLLYEAAWYTSWKELWRWRRVVVSFATLVVIVTSLVVALVSSAIIPGFTLALGFLLGAIVSPPDAVSASSVLRYVKVQKRLMSILGGESLLNDASSLIIFRFAIAAVGTGTFVFHKAAGEFVLVIFMGVAVGLAIALIFYCVHRYLPTTSNMDVVLSLVAPYVMYIVAEDLHFSGVLAVVSGGLFLSSRSHLIFSHLSRLRAVDVWSTLAFALNGLVFMLIGLELPEIISQLGPVSLTHAILYGLLISAVLIVGRILCTFAATLFTVFISRFITTADSRPGWRGPFLLGWAGMRGVVSLAAALSIPEKLPNGSPFPERNLILFITFMVILVTLVFQGLTLPWMVKKINAEDRDHLLPAPLQDQKIRALLAVHSLRFIDKKDKLLLQSNTKVSALRARFENDQENPELRVENQDEEFRDVYLEVLEEQRQLLYTLRRRPEYNDEVIRKNLSIIDLEQERLRLRFVDTDEGSE